MQQLNCKVTINWTKLYLCGWLGKAVFQRGDTETIGKIKTQPGSKELEREAKDDAHIMCLSLRIVAI